MLIFGRTDFLAAWLHVKARYKFTITMVRSMEYYNFRFSRKWHAIANVADIKYLGSACLIPTK
jgi:hypothetical protein